MMAQDRAKAGLDGPKRLQKESKRKGRKSNPFWFRSGSDQDPTMARPGWPEISKMTPKATPKNKKNNDPKMNPKMDRKRHGLEIPARELEGQKHALAAARHLFFEMAR